MTVQTLAQRQMCRWHIHLSSARLDSNQSFNLNNYKEVRKMADITLKELAGKRGAEPLETGSFAGTVGAGTGAAGTAAGASAQAAGSSAQAAPVDIAALRGVAPAVPAASALNGTLAGTASAFSGVAGAPAAQQTRQLSPAEQKKVAEIRAQIDLTDSQALEQYGVGAQKNIADFADHILATVRSKDTGTAGELMRDLLSDIDDVGVDKLNDGAGIPFFGSLKRRIQNFRARYEKMEVQIDRISAALDKNRMVLLKDVGMFDTMYEKNLEYFHSLDLFILAGEEELAHLRNEVLPKLHAEAQTSDDPMAPQLVRDYENAVTRFEKKIYDLKLSRTIAMQTAPQIRLIQDNDKALVDKIQGAILHTIPIWKNQIVISLGLANQQSALKMQQEVTRTTNELLKRNAELLHSGSVSVARETEKGIVELETLQKVNQDLISTIQETIQIHEQGHQARMQAEQEIMKLETDLKQTMLGKQA